MQMMENAIRVEAGFQTRTKLQTGTGILGLVATRWALRAQ